MEEILQTAGIIQKSAMFLQSTGDHIFKAPFNPLTEREGISSQQLLTYMEKNAIQYAAGYVPRSQKKKLAQSTNPIKKKLSLLQTCHLCVAY